jgi:hypothetical protein
MTDFKFLQKRGEAGEPLQLDRIIIILAKQTL